MGEDLILATMPLIPKYEVEEVLGVIYGSSTRTRGVGGRFIASFPLFQFSFLVSKKFSPQLNYSICHKKNTS